MNCVGAGPRRKCLKHVRDDRASPGRQILGAAAGHHTVAHAQRHLEDVRKRPSADRAQQCGTAETSTRAAAARAPSADAPPAAVSAVPVPAVPFPAAPAADSTSGAGSFAARRLGYASTSVGSASTSVGSASGAGGGATRSAYAAAQLH